MFERFTERAIRVIMAAQEEAKRLESGQVGCEHLILGMLRENEPVVVKTIEYFRASPTTVKSRLEEELQGIKELPGSGELPFTPAVKKVIEYAWEEARGLGHTYIGVEHLFLAILREGTGLVAKIFAELGIVPSAAKSRIVSLLGEEGTPGKKLPTRTLTPVLDQFSRDLTRLAREGKLDPVIGRAAEIERVIQILSRRKKNNPVLLGEAGVGKTAIVEGLAQRIVSSNVPPPLLGHRVVTLDLGLMIAGTRYRGEFEERLKKAMEEIRKAGKIVVFIDEIHTLIGAGAAEGAMDAANILKPALARGEIKCIGATTLDEYRKKIESDPALERRFQSVMVEEPTVAETIEILKGLKTRYEEFHKVRISPDALAAASRLSDRYISDRRLPDKAIDLIDEAASKAMLKSITMPPELIELSQKIDRVKADKEIAVSDQEFERAAQLRDEEETLREKYEEAARQVKVDYDQMPVVDSEAIAQIVSSWTRVPVSQLTAEETERLLKMDEELKKHVVGQEEAISAIAKSIRRARAGLKDPKRPIGSFIFLGPSGVGKTELAKRLAEFLFGDMDALVRIDMSEYLESHTVSRLLGSPPGYVGFGEGGQLTEPVRRKPHSVVLFDEIEKAHQDVLNTLLQILDDGQATDAQGRKIDFKNTVIVMTSNVGAEFISKETQMGFVTRNDTQASYDRIKTTVLDELKKRFRPEFLNRVDETVVFRPLSKEDLGSIVDILIGELNSRVTEKGMSLTLTKKVKDFLVEKGYDPKFGARPLRRTIEEHIESPLAEEVLRGKFSFGFAIKADLKKGLIVFTGKKTSEKKISVKEDALQN